MIFKVQRSLGVIQPGGAAASTPPGWVLGYILGRSMIDFVIVSSYLQQWALDTWAKWGTELSINCHLVVGWIRWQGRMEDRPGMTKRIVRVDWELLEEALACEIFNFHPQQSFDSIPMKAGDTTFCTSTVVQSCSCNVVRAYIKKLDFDLVIVAIPKLDGGKWL